MSLDPAGWLERAQAIPEGSRLRTTHDCGDGKVLTVDHKATGWGAWCHRCSDDGWVFRPRESFSQRLDRMQKTRAVEQAIEADASPPWPAEHDVSAWPNEARVWLYKAGLNNDTIRTLGFYYHPPSKRVVMPVYEGGRCAYWQARGFDKSRPKYLNPVARKAVFSRGSSGPIVITEDILSAVRVGDSGGGVGWCVMGTSLPDSVLLTLMRRKEPVVVWLDPDAAGLRGTGKFVTKLRAMGVDARRHTSELDPKFYSREEIVNQLRPYAASPAQVS
jgi:hypothetical protein